MKIKKIAKLFSVFALCGLLSVPIFRGLDNKATQVKAETTLSDMFPSYDYDPFNRNRLLRFEWSDTYADRLSVYVNGDLKTGYGNYVTFWNGDLISYSMSSGRSQSMIVIPFAIDSDGNKQYYSGIGDYDYYWSCDTEEQWARERYIPWDSAGFELSFFDDNSWSGELWLGYINLENLPQTYDITILRPNGTTAELGSRIFREDLEISVEEYIKDSVFYVSIYDNYFENYVFQDYVDSFVFFERDGRDNSFYLYDSGEVENEYLVDYLSFWLGDDYTFILGFSPPDYSEVPFLTDIYNNGYNNGYSVGYTAGYDVGFGENQAQGNVASQIFSGILEVALVPVNFFLAVLNFDVFGINISAFVTGIITVVLTIIVIKTVTGKGGD